MKMTALYERISREDRNEGESFSILRQKEYLEAYAAATALKTAGIIRTTDSADETLNVRAGSR